MRHSPLCAYAWSKLHRYRCSGSCSNDGVMPQTVEAINHAKAAGVEIIVAINKVDKPSANIESKTGTFRVRTDPGRLGRKHYFRPGVRKDSPGYRGTAGDDPADFRGMRTESQPEEKARGLVIEAQLDKGKGPVATILVQKGTLHVGDFIAAGASSGKVRAMMDDKGRRVKEAGPSTPVEILGLSDVPNIGEVLVATENDKEARTLQQPLFLKIRTVCWKKQKRRCLWMICSARFRKVT